MVRTDQQLPPGFDDASSAGFVKKVQIDDMSSQGSYLKKNKMVHNFDDQQSTGSYMQKGYTGAGDGKDLFNADDDDQSDVQLERGSIYASAQLMDSENANSKSKQVKPIQSNPNTADIEDHEFDIEAK